MQGFVCQQGRWWEEPSLITGCLPAAARQPAGKETLCSFYTGKNNKMESSHSHWLVTNSILHRTLQWGWWWWWYLSLSAVLPLMLLLGLSIHLAATKLSSNWCWELCTCDSCELSTAWKTNPAAEQAGEQLTSPSCYLDAWEIKRKTIAP